MLVEIGKKPIDMMTYLRDRDELGAVTVVMLPDDDMALDLVICQTKTIWDGIHRLPTPRRPRLLVYNLVELASCSGVLDIYAGAGETLVDDGPGIAHAASWAYEQLGKKSSTRTAVRRPAPLVFKDKFLPLMKALLLSRVIAKSPLCNANDIRGLSRAKDAFEAKGYEGEDLIKLLIVTPLASGRPKRMESSSSAASRLQLLQRPRLRLQRAWRRQHRAWRRHTACRSRGVNGPSG